MIWLLALVLGVVAGVVVLVFGGDGSAATRKGIGQALDRDDERGYRH